MGLDMNMYKYNMKLDEETFKKVYMAINLDIADETLYLNRFEEVKNNYTPNKFVEFCETYMHPFIIDKIKEDALIVEDVIQNVSGVSYEEFIYEENYRQTEYLSEIFNKVSREVEGLKEKIKIYNEVEDKVNTIVTSQPIAYWRKHSDLNGYMEDLYYERGGQDQFNCVPLYLTKEDIEMIIEDHKIHLDKDNDISIKESRGFFWGETTEEDWEESLKDFERILAETDWDNETVYYSCWW